MKWPPSAYDRDQLPERMLQFGSGMLLRALCVTAVDSANRAGARAGRIVVVQSTTEGASRTRALNAQDGLFTLKAAGARRLSNAFSAPKLRIVVEEDAVPFHREGKNVFRPLAQWRCSYGHDVHAIQQILTK